MFRPIFHASEERPCLHDDERRRIPLVIVSAKSLNHASQNAQDDDGNEDRGDYENGEAGGIVSGRVGVILSKSVLPLPLYSPFGRGDHRIDAGGKARGIVAGLEMRRDLLIDDLLAGRIRQRAFQAVIRLDE